MKKSITWSVVVESVIILISILAILSRGGHSGMMIFLLLHMPSSVLSIFIGDFARQVFSSELMGGVFTVITSVASQLFLFVIILFSLSALAKYIKSIKHLTIVHKYFTGHRAFRVWW